MDSLTVSVIWGRFVTVAEEMGKTVRRTAYSEAVREGGDFSIGVFDVDGRLLSQADLSPGHLGAMPFAVDNMLEAYPRETLKPRDVIIMNDLYMGSGHLPDFYCMKPVFLEETLVGFTVASAHLIDIGGTHPGGQGVEGITECYQEGLRLPPTKLYDDGEKVDAIFRIIEANVRIPVKVIGDLNALRNALHTGERSYVSLLEHYGLETVTAATNAFLDQSEAAVRKCLLEIPDGEYSFSEYLDDVGPGTERVKLAVTVKVEGDSITFDFSDSDPQRAAAINSPINFTRAYCYWTAKAITTKNDIPQNAGQLRPVSVVAPEGNFFNPTPPAAAGGRSVLNQRIVEIIFGALAKALPERVTAGSGQWCNPIMSGTDPKTGRRFVMYDYLVGGVGARFSRDGVSALSPVFSLENVPIETQESNYPILVKRYELVQDSGGAGRFRGGLSVRKDTMMLCTDGEVTNLSDRHQFQTYGLHGGESGSLGRSVLNPDSDMPVRMESKGSYHFDKGAVLSYQCSGSGGFGAPKERDRDLVLEDLKEGRISEKAARESYGLDI